MAGELTTLYPSTAPAAADPGSHSPASTETRAEPSPLATVPDVLTSVRWSEPPATSPADYGAIFPYERMTPEERADHDAALAAAVKAKVGITQLAAAVRLARATTRPGYRQLTEEQGMAALSKLWGDAATANLATARGFIDRMAKDWPGIRQFLRTNSLGNDPAMIALAYEKAVRSE